MFEKIKQKRTISYEDLEYFSKNYSLREYRDDIEIVPKTMNVDFCQDIDIKYDYDYNYLRNLLDNYVYFVEELLFAKKEIESLRQDIVD